MVKADGAPGLSCAPSLCPCGKVCRSRQRLDSLVRGVPHAPQKIQPPLPGILVAGSVETVAVEVTVLLEEQAEVEDGLIQHLLFSQHEHDEQSAILPLPSKKGQLGCIREPKRAIRSYTSQTRGVRRLPAVEDFASPYWASRLQQFANLGLTVTAEVRSPPMNVAARVKTASVKVMRDRSSEAVSCMA